MDTGKNEEDDGSDGSAGDRRRVVPQCIFYWGHSQREKIDREILWEDELEAKEGNELFKTFGCHLKKDQRVFILSSCITEVAQGPRSRKGCEAQSIHRRRYAFEARDI